MNGDPFDATRFYFLEAGTVQGAGAANPRAAFIKCDRNIDTGITTLFVKPKDGTEFEICWKTAGQLIDRATWEAMKPP